MRRLLITVGVAALATALVFLFVTGALVVAGAAFWLAALAIFLLKVAALVLGL